MSSSRQRSWKCLFGRHVRSRRAARLDPITSNYVSRCSFCDVPMERLGKNRWIVRGSGPGVRGRTGIRKSPAPAVVLGTILALVAGTAGGWAALDTVRSARASGFFGGQTVPALEAAPIPKSSDEDRAAGAALAATLQIRAFAGCYRLEAKFRQGCVRYIRAQQGSRPDAGPDMDAAQRRAAADLLSR